MSFFYISNTFYKYFFENIVCGHTAVEYVVFMCYLSLSLFVSGLCGLFCAFVCVGCVCSCAYLCMKIFIVVLWRM